MIQNLLMKQEFGFNKGYNFILIPLFLNCMEKFEQKNKLNQEEKRKHVCSSANLPYGKILFIDLARFGCFFNIHYCSEYGYIGY